MGKEKEKETEKPKGSFIPIEWFFKKRKTEGTDALPLLRSGGQLHF